MSAEQHLDRHVDRTDWPAGPWDGEPDRVEWRASGLPCLILRGPVGALCGYVAVPPGHPLHGASYDDAPVEAHGGLTYADACSGHICHVPRDGEPDAVWWFGFDCAHSGDLSPGMSRVPLFLTLGSVYRDVTYVTAEVTHLAEQLAELGGISEHPSTARAGATP